MSFNTCSAVLFIPSNFYSLVVSGGDMDGRLTDPLFTPFRDRSRGSSLKPESWKLQDGAVLGGLYDDFFCESFDG